MEDYKKKSVVDGDKEIVFSKAIKAGKRIYYLDVKKNRKDEMSKQTIPVSYFWLLLKARKLFREKVMTRK